MKEHMSVIGTFCLLMRGWQSWKLRPSVVEQPYQDIGGDPKGCLEFACPGWGLAKLLFGNRSFDSNGFGLAKQRHLVRSVE